MSDRLLVCPACARRSCATIKEEDGYDVFQCAVSVCGQIWRTPMLGHVKMGSANEPCEGRKYSGAFYQETYCRKKGIPTFAERWSHDYRVALLRLKAIQSHRRPGPAVSLLDVGCGNGAFVAAALDAGYNAFGIDPGEAVIEWARARDERMLARLATKNVVPRAVAGWKVVTCHDVLEHLADPFAHLQAMVDAMALGGLLVIEEPDPTCDEARRDGAAWRHIKALEHTYLPSPKTWCDMMERAGLRVVASHAPVPSKIAIYATKS